MALVHRGSFPSSFKEFESLFYNDLVSVLFIFSHGFENAFAEALWKIFKSLCVKVTTSNFEQKTNHCWKEHQQVHFCKPSQYSQLFTSPTFLSIQAQYLGKTGSNFTMSSYSSTLAFPRFQGLLFSSKF